MVIELMLALIRMSIEMVIMTIVITVIVLCVTKYSGVVIYILIITLL